MEWHNTPFGTAPQDNVAAGLANLEEAEALQRPDGGSA